MINCKYCGTSLSSSNCINCGAGQEYVGETKSGLMLSQGNYSGLRKRSGKLPDLSSFRATPKRRLFQVNEGNPLLPAGIYGRIDTGIFPIAVPTGSTGA